MSSAALVIRSALRFIYKQTTFRNIFLIFRRKYVLTLDANFLQQETICMQFQITLSGKNKKYNNVKDQSDLLLRHFYWKNMKHVSLCSPVFYVPVTELSYEGK